MNRTAMWALGVIAGLYIIGYVASEIRAANDASREESLTPQQRKQEFQAVLRRTAPAVCRSFIKEQLRDPDSAEFLLDDTVAPVEIHSDGIYLVGENVRANNGFGGKTLSTFACKMFPPVDNNPQSGWRLEDLQEVAE